MLLCYILHAAYGVSDQVATTFRDPASLVVVARADVAYPSSPLPVCTFLPVFATVLGLWSNNKRRGQEIWKKSDFTVHVGPQ